LERCLLLLEEGDHLARDVALIEAVAGGDDAGAAAVALVCAFGLDHTREGTREAWKLDGLARLVHGVVGLEPVALVLGPALEEFQVPGDRRGSARAQRKALSGIF